MRYLIHKTAIKLVLLSANVHIASVYCIYNINIVSSIYMYFQTSGFPPIDDFN